MKTITILIVDDHHLIRESWTEVLGTDENFIITGNADNGESAVLMAGRLRPDIILLDINLGDTTGFAVLPLLHAASPGSGIIAFSMHNIAGYARRMMKDGARGYVTKSSPPAELREAILRVHAGEQYLCQEMRLFRYTS